MAGLLGGLTGAAGGGALDGLTGGGLGDTLGNLTGGGLSDTLGGLTGTLGGLTGLLGSGEGLSVLGIVGIGERYDHEYWRSQLTQPGSDDPNLLDLNPAEKKTVKAQKAALAKKNREKREAAIRQLQEQVRKQGGQPTPEQAALAQQLQQSQTKEDAEMQKLDSVLGPTDPDLLQQAVANGGNVPSASPSSGLFYAYLVNSQTAQPTHLATFATVSAAQAWYRQAATTGVQKAGPQMFMYSGAAPAAFGGHMAMMPINTVQPILPLQRADGYPICCKPDPGTGGRPSSGGSGGPPGQSPWETQKPPRQKVTHESAANTIADSMIAQGDPRPKPEIIREVKQDLHDACPAKASRQGNGPTPTTNGAVGDGGLLGPASGALGAAGEPAGAATGIPGGGLGAATGILGGGAGPSGLASGVTGAAGGALGGVTGQGGAGDLLGGLLGSGQGLNVAGILAIGASSSQSPDLTLTRFQARTTLLFSISIRRRRKRQRPKKLQN